MFKVVYYGYKKYYSLAEALEILGKSKETLRR
jgi:hypothetical protein